MRVRTLYLCYFGVSEPLVQTQVIPYLIQLSTAGVGVHLLTFEPTDGVRDREGANEWRAALQARGITWNYLPYHKRPTVAATAYDIVRGAIRARRLARAARFDVLHGRSHVGAAMGLLARMWSGGRLIFDVRGFLPEEYAAAGVWRPNGPVYRLVKRAERRLFDMADGFVMLTNRARAVVFPDSHDGLDHGRPIEVIPCCVDSTRFTLPDAAARAQAKAELGVADRRVLVHLGTLDGWVDTETLAEVVAIAKRRDPRTFTLFLTHSSPARIARELALRHVSADHYAVRSVPTDAVPKYLHAADAGLAMYRPDISKAVASPTKIAEYLASGLPLFCTPGAGDIADVLVSERVGIESSGTTAAALSDGFDRLISLMSDPDVSARCRQVAIERFDLARVGGPRYRRLYDRVMASRA